MPNARPVGFVGGQPKGGRARTPWNGRRPNPAILDACEQPWTPDPLPENHGVGSSILPWATRGFVTPSQGYAARPTLRQPRDRRFDSESTAARLDIGRL